MIYQPRNVQPSSTSIDGSVDNIFSMEIQTNSYVSAYQLLIVDFNNNAIYTGSKTTLSDYLYNGDTLEIPVSASSVALSNGTNYKWRVRLYQPNSDMLITYGLVQSTSTTTNIYLQPNINIKVGMTLTINSQSKTISSYNSDTGLAVVSSAFSSVPAVGTQYYIYSDFIETVPDYIVYARRTPGVSISNIPTSLTLKYHTFQGIYNQSDNVPIVYHKFDLYLQNNDGSRTLIDTSGKVYSANLSYTYDAFRTGSTYLIQMTVENDMGVIATTDLYSFNVSYDIVEYLQQPVATFYNKENAVNIAWVTPVEHDATSFRSDAATGTIQDNSDTFTQTTFEPGQSIGEGDVIQTTNSDFDMVLYGKSEQETRDGKNLLNSSNMEIKTSNGITSSYDKSTGIITFNGTCTVDNTRFSFSNSSINFIANKTKMIAYYEGGSITNYCSFRTFDSNWTNQDNLSLINLSSSNPKTRITSDRNIVKTNIDVRFDNGSVADNFKLKLMITDSDDDSYELYGISPSPDYPSEIETVKGVENLFTTEGQKENILIIDTGETKNVNFNTTDYLKVERNKQYTVSTKVNDSSLFQIVISQWDSNKSFIKRETFQNSENSSYTLTLSDTTKYVRLSYRTDLTLHDIMLEKGSIAHPYVPYGAWLQVKDIGKNLFDINNQYKVGQSFTYKGIIVTYSEDGYITLNGTASSNGDINIVPQNYTITLDKDVYLCFEKVSGSISVDRGFACEAINKSGESVWSYVAKESVPIKKVPYSDIVSIRWLRIAITSGIVFNNYKIRCWVSTENSLDFEPYQEISTLIDMNKPNLFDKDNANIFEGLIDGSSKSLTLTSGRKTIYISCKPNTTYTIQKIISSRFAVGYTTEIPNNGVSVRGITTKNSDIKMTITTDTNANYLCVFLYHSTYDTSITLQEILDSIKIYEGSSAKDYYELCSNKNETVRDEYNITTGKGIKRIGEVVLDGSESDWNKNYASSGVARFYISLPNCIAQSKLISTHFINANEENKAYINKYGQLVIINPFNNDTSLVEWETWLSNNPITVQYILETPEEFTTQPVDTSSLKVDGKNYLTVNTNIDSTFDLVYPYKTITGNTNDYTLFNPVGVSNTGTIKSYNALTGAATLMADRPFTYIPMKGDNYAVISNIYNVSGFSYLYNTPYNTVNSLYTHGYTATWSTPDGLCVLPDDFNITLQFSLDSNFYYDKDGFYQEIVNLITTETDGENGEGQFDISVDKNKLVFTRKPDISLEVPFYTGISQVFVLSSNSVAQINNDYIWDDTATWTDTYTWVEGGTSLERICNHWWKVQITNKIIKVEEIYPTA